MPYFFSNSFLLSSRPSRKTLCCGLWGSAFTLLGYFSWRNIDRAAQIASTGAFIVGTVVGIGLGYWVVRTYLRTPAQRAHARDAASQQ